MPTIGVFQVPSRRELAWRLAIYHAVNARGWLSFEGRCEPTSETSTNRLMVTSNPADVDLDYVDHWVVLTADAARSAAYLGDELKVGSSGVGMIASHLAAADILARRGAPVFGDDAASISIAEVEGIALSDAESRDPGGSSLEGPAREALAMYAAMPIKIGAAGFWSPSLYKQPIREDYGLDVIDLTGRTRTIIQGPYIPLPPGVWRMTADFEIVTPPEGGQFLFAWGAAGHMTEWSGFLPRSGRYQLQLESKWLTIAPAEFNVALLNPMFCGQLEMLGTVVEKIG